MSASQPSIPQIKCPDCKTSMPYTAAACPSCKRRMVQVSTSSTLSATGTPRTTETLVCSACQTINSVAQVYCSNCRAVLPYKRSSRPSSTESHRPIIIIACVIGLVVLIGIIASQRESKSTYVPPTTGSIPSSTSGSSYKPPATYASSDGLGPMPKNSEWNGSVAEVDSYLKSNLNDYDSAEYLEWSPVKEVKLEDTSYWAVRLKLRAKNGFGAYIVKDVYFFIRNGKVVRTEGL